MIEYDILLFDVKDFSKQPSFRQIEIKRAIQNCIGSFFKIIGKNYKSVSTGDGYYICLESSDQNHFILLDLISILISELEDIEIRFALHTGMLEEITEINNSVSLIGPPFNDLSRFIAGISSANIILTSRLFYEKFFNGTLILKKVLGPTRSLTTFKKFFLQDKHGKTHELYNISYTKNQMEYGFEFTEDEITVGINDDIDFEDFKKTVEYSFGRKKATIIRKVELNNPAIHYCYLYIDISQYTKEYFLFIKNHSVKTQTIDHFLKNNTVSEPLTICANKKYLDEKWNEFWEKDLLEKLNVKAPSLKKISFYYFDDFLWENCIPETLKLPVLFDEESNFINPEYNIESAKQPKNKTNIEEYLLKFLKNDPAPIALLKGSGGMGKTTLLKRISDLLSMNSQYQKFVFYLDGQNFAKHLYKNEDIQLEKIETLADLLRLYFNTLSPTGNSFNTEAPIVLNNELVNIVISSGKVVIMVDGLDEISGSLKENFSLNTFISDVVNINKILNHSKIIISTRDYYWDKALSQVNSKLIEKFKIITLKGFDESMAEEYFDKKFDGNDEKKNKGLIILKSLTRSKTINTFYWPFLVYLVSDIVLKEKGSKSELNLAQSDFESKYLDAQIEFDYIIINFCLREKKRQNLDLEVDDFVDLFKEIIIEHEGEMGLDSFREYVLTLLPSVADSGNGFEGFKTLLINPLVKEKNLRVMMSIDFIQYHLCAAFLSHFILNNVHSPHIYRLLSRYYDGKEDILKDINMRLKKGKIEIETIKAYFKKIVSALKKEDLILSEKLILQKCVSTLLYLSFKLFESRVTMGMEERTKLLKEIYDNELDNIHIYGDFYTLDFSSLTIRNSTFNYNINFFKSNRDDKTLLIDSKVEISHAFYGVSESSAWSEKNFDKSCIISSDLKIILRRTKAHRISDFFALKKDINVLLQRFQKSGRWILQTEAHLDFPTSSKLTSAQLIHEMQYFNIIVKNPGKFSHNWAIIERAKDSVNQLLHNNHIDSTFEKIINHIYTKYYT